MHTTNLIIMSLRTILNIFDLQYCTHTHILVQHACRTAFSILRESCHWCERLREKKSLNGNSSRATSLACRSNFVVVHLSYFNLFYFFNKLLSKSSWRTFFFRRRLLHFPMLFPLKWRRAFGNIMTHLSTIAKLLFAAAFVTKINWNWNQNFAIIWDFKMLLPFVLFKLQAVNVHTHNIFMVR